MVLQKLSARIILPMKLKDLVTECVDVSEKAATLARTIRAEQALFKLLVEEKTGEQKNTRFVHDFKTFSDVLVQETVRHDLEQKFPGLSEFVYGEETNKFTNTLGECVIVQVQSTPRQTCQLFGKVLDGHEEAALLLAQVVHSEVKVEADERLESLNVEVDPDDVGIWVDPIDSTSQYISGINDVATDDGIYLTGLQCVTVLIGAFSRRTGLPFIGVINQPFLALDSTDGKWYGRWLWGVAYQCTYMNSWGTVAPQSCSQMSPALTCESSKTERLIVSSSSEDGRLLSRLESSFHLDYPAGAGYKLLCVIDELASLYVLRQGSTFKWDTCAPHAILLSKMGGVVNLTEALEVVKVSGGDKPLVDLKNALQQCQLKYNRPDGEASKWNNAGGIVAYADLSTLIEMLKLLI